MRCAPATSAARPSRTMNKLHNLPPRVLLGLSGGADSVALLGRVVERITAEGYTIGNIDATILCQRPKLAPHIPQMRQILADACGIPTDRVSVKATTEEGLGFTGSGEGIAAHCVCLLK